MTAHTYTSAGFITRDAVPNQGLKILHVRTPATFVNGTDTFAIDLKKYGISVFVGFHAFRETTAGSVIAPFSVTTATTGLPSVTTAVSDGVLTFTPTLPATTCITDFIIYGL